MEYYHTRRIVLKWCGLCLWIAFEWFMFDNEYSQPIHALCYVTACVQNAWRHNAEQSYQRSNNSVRHSVTMLHPFKWHVSQRFSNAMEQIANLKEISSFNVSNSLGKRHVNSVLTQYVCDKNENARACAKWQWNALNWCYWIAHTVISHTPVRSCYKIYYSEFNNKPMFRDIFGRKLLYQWYLRLIQI